MPSPEIVCIISVRTAARTALNMRAQQQLGRSHGSTVRNRYPSTQIPFMGTPESPWVFLGRLANATGGVGTCRTKRGSKSKLASPRLRFPKDLPSEQALSQLGPGSRRRLRPPGRARLICPLVEVSSQRDGTHVTGWQARQQAGGSESSFPLCCKLQSGTSCVGTATRVSMPPPELPRRSLAANYW